MDIWNLIWFVALPVLVIGMLMLLRFADDPSDDEQNEQPAYYILLGHRYVPYRSNAARYVIWKQTSLYTLRHEPDFPSQMANYTSPINWN